MDSPRNPDPLEIRVQQWLDLKFRDPKLAAIHGRDDRFPHITERTIRAALESFSLPLKSSRTHEWLAVAVRRSLALTTPNIEGMPERYPGNGAIRDKFRSLADEAKHLANELDNFDSDTLATIISLSDDNSWMIFEMAIANIHGLAEILECISDNIKIEKGKWRASAMKELRIRQAHYLSPIFETAFGAKATVSDRVNSKSLGSWPEFLGRMVLLADGVTLSKDQLRIYTKEGRRRHLDEPISIPKAIMPT